MFKKIFERMQEKHNQSVEYTTAMHRYILLKQALNNNVIHPVDKQYWEELIQVYEFNLKNNNKDTDIMTFMMIKEEYQLYLSKLENYKKQQANNNKTTKEDL